MAKVKEDISRVRLQVDGKQGINELGKLEMEAKELQIDMKNAKKGTDEYVRANKKLAEVRKQIRGLREELGLSGMTLGQLTRYQRELRNEIRHTVTSGTKDYKRLKAELRDVNKEIRNQNAELRGSKGFFSGIKKELMSFGVIALSALGATEIFSQFQSMIDGSARLSDALADVQKTTNLTDEELEKLSKTLKTFNTRTPRRELLGLAEIAGRLGITSRKDIEGFVRAADKINVSLGDALGDPEKVMRELGKLTDTYDIKAALGIEDSLLKVGSAINDLGMASTANEGYLVEFTKRMGGVAPLAKITIQDVLGLGATLDSLGQTSEVSSTALSKLFLDMAKNAKQYAKYANMEVSEFVDLMNNDANEAFLRVLEGVKGNSEGITQLAATMVDLEQDGGRVIGVLGTLANNTEKLRQQQDIANSSFEKGTSVIDEFNTKNNNFAANLEKVQKWLAGLFVNGAILEGLNQFVGAWARWTQVPLSETLQAERVELNKMMIRLTSANTETEDRVRIIKELKQQYPDHLANINAETVSNEKLSKAVQQVNEDLINRIIVQEKEEEIADQNRRIASLRMSMLEEEDKLIEEMSKVSDKFNLKIFEGLSLEDQARTLLERAEPLDNLVQDRHGELVGETAELISLLANYKYTVGLVNDAEKEGKYILEEKNRLMDRLGIKSQDNTETPNPNQDPTTPTTTDGSGVPGNPEKAKQKLDSLEKEWKAYLEKIAQLTREYELAGLEDEQREVALVQEKYSKLSAELNSFLASGEITQKEHSSRLVELELLKQQEIDGIQRRYREKEKQDREEAKQKILEATSSEKQLAIQKTNEHYDQLLELARKFGLDSTGIEKARRTALADLQKKYSQEEVNHERQIAEAKIQIAQGLSQAIGGAIDFIGNRSGELTTFQKVLTGAQIALDLASGLGKIVPLAVEASQGTGPAAPFVFAGHLATMGGMVLTAIGKAKQALSSSNVPQWDGDSSSSSEEKSSRPQGNRRSSSTATSYYHGGDTGGTGLGIGDRYGEFTGYVHKDEYVVPSFIRSHPYVADVLPAIEAIRQEKSRGFYKGGETTTTKAPTSPVNQSDPELVNLMKIMIQKLDAMPTSIKAYLVDSELEEFRDKRQKLKDKYIK